MIHATDSRIQMRKKPRPQAMLILIFNLDGSYNSLAFARLAFFLRQDQLRCDSLFARQAVKHDAELPKHIQEMVSAFLEEFEPAIVEIFTP